MRRTLAVITITAAIAAMMAVATPPASAAGNAAASFVRLINMERAQAGRAPLHVHPELTAYAIRHTRDMAATDSIWHTQHVSRAVSVGTVVGENVGYEHDVASTHAAFMASPGHRANVLDSDYSMVGVGVLAKDGWIYVTEIFAGSPHAQHRAVAVAVAPVRPTTPAPVVDAGRNAGAQHQTNILLQLNALDQ